MEGSVSPTNPAQPGVTSETIHDENQIAEVLDESQHAYTRTATHPEAPEMSQRTSASSAKRTPHPEYIPATHRGRTPLLAARGGAGRVDRRPRRLDRLPVDPPGTQASRQSRQGRARQRPQLRERRAQIGRDPRADDAGEREGGGRQPTRHRHRRLQQPLRRAGALPLVPARHTCRRANRPLPEEIAAQEVVGSGNALAPLPFRGGAGGEGRPVLPDPSRPSATLPLAGEG